MMFKTHVVFGILLGLLAMPYLAPENKVIFIIIAAVAAGLPDIDSADSKFGSKIKVIGWIFDHRGIFHTLFAVAILSALFFAISRNIPYTAAFFIGYFSHILIDSLNREGVMPLYPLTKFRLRGFLKTGGIFEFLLFMVMLVLIVLIVLNFIKVF